MRIHRTKRASKDIIVITYPLQRPRGFAELSAAELDVIEGVLSGLTQAAVARRQGVAKRTVANQLASAYRKLRVNNVAELSVLCSAWPSVRGKRG